MRPPPRLLPWTYSLPKADPWSKKCRATRAPAERLKTQVHLSGLQNTFRRWLRAVAGLPPVPLQRLGMCGICCTTLCPRSTQDEALLRPRHNVVSTLCPRSRPEMCGPAVWLDTHSELAASSIQNLPEPARCQHSRETVARLLALHNLGHCLMDAHMW